MHKGHGIKKLYLPQQAGMILLLLGKYIIKSDKINSPLMNQ